MDFSKYIQMVPVLQSSVVVFFGIGMISLLFLGIRIRYFQKSLKKWMKESKRSSKDPALDQIIKRCRAYKEDGSEKMNTKAIIHSNYYRQKIFFIPIYYWEQLISKSEILSLFLGLLGTFILVSEKMENAFFPLILSTILFIILVALETILALQERRNFIFTQLEEYLDNVYLTNLNKTSPVSEIFAKENIEPLHIYDKELPEQGTNDETKNELNDTEIEWIIKQFYGEEKRV